MGELPSGGTLHVALSGGRDSVVLLHLAVLARNRLAPRLRPALTALHVDHGLQPAAADFVGFCRALCRQWAIPLSVVPVTVDTTDGIEAGARRARYAAFAERLGRDDVLWLAHHRGDQAETVLLRLMRGAGVTGLSGMPRARALGGGRLVRPLLGLEAAAVAEHADRHGLAWQEDPSNRDDRFDRNHIRHRVMPALSERWMAEACLAQSADQLGEADELLDELAGLDLARLGQAPGRLPLAGIVALSRPRQRLLIRGCLRRLALPLPSRPRLESLLEQCAEARRDSRIHLDWSGAEARVWRGELFLQPPVAPLPTGWQCDWQGEPGIATPAGRLDWRLVREDGAAVVVSLGPRLGGERLQRGGRHRRVKQLLQEASIPPWRRERVAIARRGSEVVALLGEGMALAADGWRLMDCRE
ncbi:tRNA lysidine(34) synthetase TilS [Kushneria sinocarnis]|nr:tRNA lysidine(34) synthetase TilS [Kushneria sinocarnis]